MKRMKSSFIAVVAFIVIATGCSKLDSGSNNIDLAEAIVGKWELIAFAMYKDQYTEDNFGTTWEFYPDGGLKFCVGTRGVTMHGDPCSIGSYEINDGYMIYKLRSGTEVGPWKCKFHEDYLEMIRIAPWMPLNYEENRNINVQAIYITNYMYFKRIY